MLLEYELLLLLSTLRARRVVIWTYDSTLQRLAVSDVANEISQKNSEDIRVCLRENRRRELRRYLLRSET